MIDLYNEKNEIHNEIKTKGFYLFKNFLSNKDLDFLTKNLLITNTKEDKASKFFFDLKTSITDLVSLNFEGIKKRRILVKLLKDYKLKKIAKTIFKSEIDSPTADIYFSPISNKPVIQWHTDQAYSGKKIVTKFVNPEKAALKFFFYLTDVDSQNGCLGYIPGSHIISFYLKKMIFEKKIEYSPYWSINDYRNLIKSDRVKSKLLEKIDEKIIDRFISDTEFVDSNKDSIKFDIKAKAGSLLIFDESGVHRGNAVTKLERKCIRIFFRKKLDI